MRLFAWLCRDDKKISSGWPVAYLSAAKVMQGKFGSVAAMPQWTGLHALLINESH